MSQKFLGRVLHMGLHIGWIAKLVRHVVVGIVLGELGGFGDSAGDFFFFWGQYNGSAIALQKCASLQGHRFRHGEYKRIALGFADQGQSNAGISRGGFDHGRSAWNEVSALLGRFYHCQCNAIFDGSARVVLFALEPNAGAILGRHLVQLQQGGIADEAQKITDDGRGWVFHTRYLNKIHDFVAAARQTELFAALD